MLFCCCGGKFWNARLFRSTLSRCSGEISRMRSTHGRAAPTPSCCRGVRFPFGFPPRPASALPCGLFAGAFAGRLAFASFWFRACWRCCCLCAFGGFGGLGFCCRTKELRGRCATHGYAAPAASPSASTHLANWIPSLINLHLLIGFVRLHRLRPILQRIKTAHHVVIVQHRQITHHLHIRFRPAQSRGRHSRNVRVPAQPNRRQQQHRRRKRHARRRRKPRPPARLRRFRRYPRAHAHIKRRRRLDHRQFVQQPAHRAKFIHAQAARRARQEMLLHLQRFALFQAPVHVRQNFVFHPSTTHVGLPLLPLVYFTFFS